MMKKLSGKAIVVKGAAFSQRKLDFFGAPGRHAEKLISSWT
jgi:hypothetical protein